MLGLSRVDTIILKKTSGGSFNINESSSGERSLLLLICSIANEIKNNSLICIDEPEISLHPEWQEQFIQLISEVFKTYRNCHFLIATHSPLIISKLKTKSCFVLDLDHNELLNSEMFKSKSADYQLARLFNTPGEQNEYLKRLCVNVLAALSKGKKLTDDYRNDAEFLITYQEKLLPEDTVYQLIEIIKNALEVIGES
jgi:predicted ATPase